MRGTYARCAALGCVVAAAMAAAGCGGNEQKLHGTLSVEPGALAQPLVHTWARGFRKTTGVPVLSRTAGRADFVADDGGSGPLGADEVAVPVAIEPIAIAYNLETVIDPHRIRSGLKLDGPMLTGMYRGKLFNWHQKRFLAMNPELEIPDELIVMCHRTDPSGTTTAFTRFLSRAREVWARNRGSGPRMRSTEIVPRLTRGDDGVARCVKKQGGAMAYMGLPSARRHGLTVAAIRGAGSGAYVLPGAPADAGYPITTVTSMVVPRDPCAAGLPAHRATNLKAWLTYALGDGQRMVARLGYRPLPPDMRSRARAHVAALRCSGRPIVLP